MHYAIQIIGTGRNARYTLKQVTGTMIVPVNGRAYRTEEAARAAAEDLGIEIAKVGNNYQIL